MTFKRRVLSALTKAELLELGRGLELEVKAAMAVDDLRDLLASSKRAKLERLVTTDLKLDQLKAICEACDLDTVGKEKQVLVDRILTAGGRGGDADGEAKQPGLALPTPDEAANQAAKASLASTPRAPRGKKDGESSEDPTNVVSYRHRDRRRNNPEVGMVAVDSDPGQPKTTYAYDPHLDPVLQFDVGRAQVENLIDDALASGDEATMRAALEQLKRQAEPYLAWTGKAERTTFEVDTVSLHVHERIDPASILAAARKGMKASKAFGTSARERHVQYGLFSAPFENLPLRDAIDFYKHDKGWSNRLIAGDSLLVMNSLLQKEGMAGQVQMIYIDPPYGIRYGSNFQPFVGTREVKDGSDADLTQEPEMIKAFRDTWELGLHSYLTYLRDRIVLGRELLSAEGSLFVQISDENLHHVRELMDDVFGASNFVSMIVYRKTTTASSEGLATVCDYLLWYGKNRSVLKYRPLYLEKELGEAGATQYTWIREPDGRLHDAGAAVVTHAERPGVDVFAHGDLTSQRPAQGDDLRSFAHRGKMFLPNKGTFKTDLRGLTRLSKAGRLLPLGDTLRYCRFLRDYAVTPLSHLWEDTVTSGFGDKKVFVVQTNPTAIERCLLMTTDPGDLVLDPTCGSGTTAVVAEKWGRRWMTCDTSRVAVTLAKQRLLVAGFDYFDLKYPHEGLKGGFVYKSVPHVTLKAIANNVEIDDIYERQQPAMTAALTSLNEALKIDPPRSGYSIAEGVRKGSNLDFVAGDPLMEWEVPFELPADWSASVAVPFAEFQRVRQSLQRAMDATVAAHAEQEVLRDQPRVDKDRLRITGPFSVEAVPFPSVLSLDDTKPLVEADTAIARSGETSRQHQWRDELLKTGVRGKNGQRLELVSLESLPDTRHLHATGSLADSGDRVVVSFGPEHGALEQRQVEMAMREAEKLFPRPKMILFCAFAFDPEAAKDIDETKGVVALKAQMNTDLLTEDLKKAKRSNQSFWLMGQPDVELRTLKDGSYQIEVQGFDYFDTVKGELVSGGTSKIAMWMLDTDYDERSLYPRQVFFPMAGKKDGWFRLKKDLRAELDETKLEKFHGTMSLPFEAGEYRKVAVKVVDDRGIESLKILSLD